MFEGEFAWTIVWISFGQPLFFLVLLCEVIRIRRLLDKLNKKREN